MVSMKGENSPFIETFCPIVVPHEIVRQLLRSRVLILSRLSAYVEFIDDISDIRTWRRLFAACRMFRSVEMTRKHLPSTPRASHVGRPVGFDG